MQPTGRYCTHNTFPNQKYALKLHKGIVMFFLSKESSFWMGYAC